MLLFEDTQVDSVQLVDWVFEDAHVIFDTLMEQGIISFMDTRSQVAEGINIEISGFKLDLFTLINCPLFVLPAGGNQLTVSNFELIEGGINRSNILIARKTSNGLIGY